MTAYTSIMILLLAFFIALQAFAPVQREGLFYAGRGSFVRALETFGLGGVWERMGGGLVPGPAGPRYLTPEGQEEASRLRRIDAEREQAQRALRELETRFDVSEPEKGAGWRVTFPTPFSYQKLDAPFEVEQEEFCRGLADRLEPLIAARGFVIRIGSVLRVPDGLEAAQTVRALEAAGLVRRKLINAMRPDLQAAAATRLYCFCRRATEEAAERRGPPAQLRVDVMLTKPYVRHFEEGAIESESATAE